LGKTITIILFNTKTDKEKTGVIKYINKVESNHSAFRLMQIMKAVKISSTKPDDAFFALKNGKPVDRIMLVKFLQLHLKSIFPQIDSNEWSGISLRKGGATTAIRSGVDPHNPISRKLEIRFLFKVHHTNF